MILICQKHGKYITIVVNETERLTKLTNSLLTLNNLNTKGMLLDKTDFDINQVIRNTASTFEGTCHNKSIAIEMILTGNEMYVHADYNVAVVAPHYLPEATQTTLQDALAAYGEDRNGDGKVVVKLNLYTMDFGNEGSDAYLDMAGTTKLSTDIQGALSSIFILYDPAGFQQTTGTLRYLDGSLPQSDADSDWWNMVYRWTDCPVLAGLDLGDYASDAVQSESGSSQELMSRYYIGIRGAWNKDSADLLEGGEELWNKLTAGAVSTASAEG